MGLLDKLTSRFCTQPMTRTRIVFALAIAVAADALQFFLGPLGWVIVDSLIDVIAMVLMIILLGFHLLLLPTFVVELIPGVDMLPTWTACVVAVVVLRKRQQRAGPETGAPPVVNAPPNPADKIVDQKRLP
jgi:hypothetical protein